MDQLSKGSVKLRKRLSELEDLVETYQPFIHDNYQIFVNRAMDAHPPMESEFHFDPRDIEWRSYWLDVHMPGLRRWTFPLFEGRQPETDRAQFPVRLEAAAQFRPVASPTVAASGEAAQ